MCGSRCCAIIVLVQWCYPVLSLYVLSSFSFSCCFMTRGWHGLVASLLSSSSSMMGFSRRWKIHLRFQCWPTTCAVLRATFREKRALISTQGHVYGKQLKYLFRRSSTFISRSKNGSCHRNRSDSSALSNFNESDFRIRHAKASFNQKRSITAGTQILRHSMKVYYNSDSIFFAASCCFRRISFSFFRSASFLILSSLSASRFLTICCCLSSSISSRFIAAISSSVFF